MDYIQLSTELHKGNVAGAYLFIAEDMYIARAYVRQIRSMLLTGEFASMNSVTFEDRKIDPRTLAAELDAMPMMAERRVVVTDPDATRAIFASSELSSVVSERISGGYGHLCLIMLSEKAPDKKNRLYSEFLKSGKVVQMRRYDRDGLSEYIRRRLSERKLTVSKEALDLFMEMVDYTSYRSEIDLGYVVNELDKLTAWCRGKKLVGAEDVKTVVSPNLSKDISLYTDDVLKGDMKGALAGMERLRFYRTPFPVVMAALDSALRQNAQFLSGKATGMSEAEIAKKYSRHPYVVKLALRNTSMSTEASLKGISILAGIDRALKKGLTDETTSFLMMTERVTSLAGK